MIIYYVQTSIYCWWIVLNFQRKSINVHENYFNQIKLFIIDDSMFQGNEKNNNNNNNKNNSNNNDNNNKNNNNKKNISAITDPI